MNSENNLIEQNSEFSQLDDEIIHVKKMPTNRTFDQDRINDEHLESNEIAKKLPSKPTENITNQYLKFVNAHLAEKLNLVEKLYQIKNNLEEEIELLKADDLTQMITLPNISVNHLNSDEINEIDTFMKLQKSLIESKIYHQKNKLEDIETELKENQLQINEMNKKKSENKIQEPFKSELDMLVKDELEFLIKKYGMKELTYAIDVITSSKIIKENQNLQ